MLPTKEELITIGTAVAIIASLFVTQCKETQAYRAKEISSIGRQL